MKYSVGDKVIFSPGPGLIWDVVYVDEKHLVTTTQGNPGTHGRLQLLLL